MEISDCIWDADTFLCCPELEDLESPLGPQLQTPFVWPEEPIIDEADNSDMTPQCMPVIDPNFVRESFIEDCLLDGISDVIAGGEDVLGGYLADQSSSEHLARLHVLVCGFCHSVFHVLDEFKSHLVMCDGSARNSSFSSYDSTSAVALVLWTNTVMRRVGESLSDSGSSHLIQRIEARWWRLSRKSRQVWEKAAEALRELAKVGNLVFPGLEQTRENGRGCCASATAADDDRSAEVARSKTGGAEEEEDLVAIGLATSCGGGNPFRWPGPHDFREADEIETQATLAVKMESEVSSAEISSVEEEEGEIVVLDPTATAPVVQPTARVKAVRDKRGRWESRPKQAASPSEETFYCVACNFRTNNQWKFKRHHATQKHFLCTGGSSGGEYSRLNAVESPDDGSSGVGEEETHRHHPAVGNSVSGGQCISPLQAAAAVFENTTATTAAASSSAVPRYRKRSAAAISFREKRGNSTRKSAISAHEKVLAWVSCLSRAKNAHLWSADQLPLSQPVPVPV